MSKKTEDVVNNPKHYKMVLPDGTEFENIDYQAAVMKDSTLNAFQGGLLAPVLKYTSRAGKKDPMKMAEDYKKARYYLDELIKSLDPEYKTWKELNEK